MDDCLGLCVNKESEAQCERSRTQICRERGRAFKAIPINQGAEEGLRGNEEQGKHKEHSRD